MVAHPSIKRAGHRDQRPTAKPSHDRSTLKAINESNHIVSMLNCLVCSTENQLIVLSPTAPNSSYEEIDLTVTVEYSGPQLIKSSQPLLFTYVGNPDINNITPKRIRNRSEYFVFLYAFMAAVVRTERICVWFIHYHFPHERNHLLF